MCHQVEFLQIQEKCKCRNLDQQMHGESLTTKWGGVGFLFSHHPMYLQPNVCASWEEVGGLLIDHTAFSSGSAGVKCFLSLRKCKRYLTNVQLPESVCVLKCVMTSWHLWKIFWRVSTWSFKDARSPPDPYPEALVTGVRDLPMTSTPMIHKYLWKLKPMWASSSGIGEIITLLYSYKGACKTDCKKALQTW